MTRPGRPAKPKTLLQEAAAVGQELEDLLKTEMPVVTLTIGRERISTTADLIRRLAKRLTRTEGLIDGYALNRARPAAMRIALEDLQKDSEVRHPRWRRRKVA